MSNFAEDYIPVAERIAAFYAKHPEGSLQGEMVELSETRVVIRAFAYRTPDDIRPGIGYSSLTIPGSTPFTRGSEIENCETSAWGRAIAALGFEVKRGVATAEEVRNKAPQAPQTAPAPRSEPKRSSAPPRTGETVGPPLMPDTSYGPADEDFDWSAVAEALGEDGGTCSVHGVPWVLKPAGVSKNGSPYDAFYSCGVSGPPWCKEKPAKAWVESHHP
jgi:hypothetical protein